MEARDVPVVLLGIRTNFDGSGYVAARDAVADVDMWERLARNQVNRFMGAGGMGRFTRVGAD